MSERCPRCGSQHHTDCTDTGKYKDPDLRYLLWVAGVCLIVIIGAGVAVVQFLVR